MEVNMEINPTVRKKNRKTYYSKCGEFIFDCKVNVKTFQLMKPLSELYDGEKMLLEQRWAFLLR